MKQEKRSNKLGKLGEKTFNLWCSQANLVCNKSAEDENGWDFTVEEQNDRNPLTFPFRSLIQIKSSDKTKPKPIKLPNLLRMCKASEATFYIFFEFDGKNEAQRVYINHVDYKLIKKAFEAAKKNQATITISRKDSIKLESLDGSCLKEKLLCAINSNMYTYITKKRWWIDKALFDEYATPKSRIAEMIESAKTIKELQNLFLGKSASEEYFKSLIENTETKFNALYTNPKETSQLEPYCFGEGYIHFQKNNDSPWLKFDVKGFSTTYEDLPLLKPYSALRLQNPLFNMFWRNNTQQAEWYFLEDYENEKRFSLTDFHNISTVLEWMQDSEKFIAELEVGKLKSSLTMDKLTQDNSTRIKEKLNGLKAIKLLLEKSELKQNIKISLYELDKYSYYLAEYYSMIKNDNGISCGINLDDNKDVNNLIEKKGIYLLPNLIPMGDHYLYIIMGIKGQVQLLEKPSLIGITSKFSDVTFEEIVCDTTENLDKNDLVQKYIELLYKRAEQIDKTNQVSEERLQLKVLGYSEESIMESISKIEELIKL